MRTYRAGAVCSVELLTADVKRARAFYGALLGWTAVGLPGPPEQCARFHSAGEDVAGLQCVEGRESRWVPCVSVDNVHAACDRARRLGGTMAEAVFDLCGVARLGTVRDPEGGEIGLWQATGLSGVASMERMGGLWWMELLANDVPAVRRFYGELFGWSTADRNLAAVGPYVVFTLGDEQMGGILPIGAGWGMAPRWQVYFIVPQCDEAIERVIALGGSHLLEARDIPSAGRIALVADAAGAIFGVVQRR